MQPRALIRALRALGATLILLSISTGCASFGRAVKEPRNPRAWGAFFLDAYAKELAPPALGPERPLGRGRTVLLVTGMAIPARFFEPMFARLVNDGFSPVIYEDPALISTGIVAAAERLAAEVERVRAETGESRIDLVAECTGGVVARYYLEVLGGGAYVDHLVTFVSPHHGTLPAALAALVTGWQGLRDISRGSAVITKLDGLPFPAEVRFTSIYSCWDSLLWPQNTAAIDDAINVEFCRRYIDHFDGFWDPVVYERIVSALTDDPAALTYY